jgi:hypothetical protein
MDALAYGCNPVDEQTLGEREAARRAGKLDALLKKRSRRASAAIKAINQMLVALGGTAESPRRKNATRYDDIAYHWTVAKRLGRSREDVAARWGVDPKTITDALRTVKGRPGLRQVSAEVRQSAALTDGRRRGRIDQQILEEQEHIARPRRKIRR